MKRNIPLLVFSILISVIALAIAIPTIPSLNIRGLDPQDLGLNFVTPYFAFQSSVDLQGGRLITLGVNLTGTDNASRQSELDLLKSTLYYRFWNARIENFSLNVVTDNSEASNKIVIKAPDSVDEQTMNLLLTPANFSVWVEDPNATDNVATGSMDSLIRQIFGKRLQVGISNTDVTSATVVSDSRCYYNDATKPSNYCIDIKFNDTAKTQLGNAIRAVPVGNLPIMVALDYTPIGIKATGQTFYDAASVGGELLIYTGVEQPLFNNVLAAMIGAEPLNSNVKMNTIQEIAPVMGTDTLLKIKIALVLAVVAANALIIYYFRKRGAVFTLSFVLFLIWSIALMKMTNMALSFPLVGGFAIASLLYISILIGTEYKIRTAFKGSLTADELKEIYSGITNKIRNLTFVIVIIDFVAGYYATSLMINFMTGMGIAMIGALLVTITIFKAILPFLLLSKKHE